MKSLRISTQLFIGFAIMVVLVLASGLVAWIESVQSEDRAISARNATTGAVALAEAQSALWQLRYGFPQFMIGDEEGRRKIVADEPKQYEDVQRALKAYAESRPTEEEQKALKGLQDVYSKYIAARPRWFELYGAGKFEEAKEWRAATTTPLGAATVKAFSDIIALQQKVSAENHEAGLKELQTTRTLMIAVASAALVLGIVLAFSIVSGLRRQLGGEPGYAKQVASSIARGDLSADVEVRPGDTGSLLWEMKQMRDSLRTVVT
ncbi:MAG TPA: MCP four helix bundle domain-containing protein, partial [Ramlibacter sp.]|nr:MCP four helix bundle domain-containing protein [Ramlibacter sp.]